MYIHKNGLSFFFRFLLVCIGSYEEQLMAADHPNSLWIYLDVQSQGHIFYSAM